MRVKADLF